MWSIKDYVLSGAVTALAETFRVVAWVPEDFVEGTKQLLATAHADCVSVRPSVKFSPGRAFGAVCKLQKSLRFERHNVATEQVMKRRSADTAVSARGSVMNALSATVRVAAKSPVAPCLEHQLARLRRSLVSTGLYADEFVAAGIDVVMTTDPTRRDADPIYFEAKRRALPVSTLVLSWDNLTSKGVIHGRFAKVMVWNEVMRDEIAMLYPWYRPNQIVIAGFPRFDVYRNPLPHPYQRSEFLHSLGLDPARPVLLFASSAAKRFRAQNQVLEHICAAMAHGEIADGVQLLIRCHPHDRIEDVRAFRDRPNVAVWPSASRATAGTLYSRLPDPDELLILGASIAHSAAVIGVGSTVMLDAARCDVPIICIAYDGDEALSPPDSIASVYGYSHQKPFHQLGATDICYSRDELLASIRRALLDPGRQAPNRRAVVNRSLGGYASSVERIREVLTSLASEQLTTLS